MPFTAGSVAYQWSRQAEVDTAKVGKQMEAIVSIRPILKHLEMEEALKKMEEKRYEEAARKEAEKMAATKKWEEGVLSQKEGETYSTTARPIWILRTLQMMKKRSLQRKLLTQ